MTKVQFRFPQWVIDALDARVAHLNAQRRHSEITRSDLVRDEIMRLVETWKKCRPVRGKLHHEGVK